MLHANKYTNKLILCTVAVVIVRTSIKNDKIDFVELMSPIAFTNLLHLRARLMR